MGGVPEQQLNRLGVQAFVEAKSKGPLSNDAKQNAYVQCVSNVLPDQGGGLLAQTGFLLPGSRVQEVEAEVLGQRLMAYAGPARAVSLNGPPSQSAITHSGAA